MTNGEKFKEVFKDTIADVGYDGLTNITKVSIFHNHYVLYFLKGWWNAEYKEPTTKNDKVDCEHTDCNNCVNHKYCDYESTTKNDLALLEKTYDDFCKCEGGEGWLKIDGKEYGTDVGYAIEGVDIFMEVFKRRLAELPSVTPQEPQTFKWCTDCKEYDQEKHCCHRWSKVIRDAVEEMKQEPKTGHWINKQNLFSSCSAECSSCHKRSNGYVHDNGFSLEFKYFDFCPKCGSDNREVEE